MTIGVLVSLVVAGIVGFVSAVAVVRRTNRVSEDTTTFSTINFPAKE